MSGLSSVNSSDSHPRSASILNNANNTHINNTVFTTNNSTTHTYNVSRATSSLDLLHKSVAPNAILNAGGRADEVRCHPGTRKEVVSLVQKSIAQDYSGPRMLWLSGPAGAGKSAIMQTVAERCRKEGVPHANFFFFRTDGSRKNIRPFVPTTMHQIIQRYPNIGPAVAASLTSDPLLFDMSIQHQFDVLLDQALATLHHTPPPFPPLVLLIDGLDECDSENKEEQGQLLRALDTLLTQKGQYFRVVIASRVEPQISMAFNELHSDVDSIFLDDKYSPEKDIHCFVTAEFERIKSSHFLASKLEPAWPSESEVAGIVAKSSGQFIFAATVMRFIARSRASPVLSLQKVQGIVPPNKNSPFAQLDAVYAYILEEVEDFDAVKVMLSIRILNNDYDIEIPVLMVVYNQRFSTAVFDSCISELAPLISMDGDRLEFYHASFPDFLQDQSRSREYHIDLETFCTAAFPIWWQHHSRSSVLIATLALPKIKQATSNITTAFMADTPTLTYIEPRIQSNNLFGEIRRIYSPRNLQTYQDIMNIWASGDPELALYIPEKFPKSTPPNRSSTPRTHQFNRQARSSTPQTHVSTSNAHSSTPKKSSSTSKIHSSSSQTQPTGLQTRSPTHQKHLSTSKARPRSDPRPSTPQPHSLTPPICQSISQARPVTTQNPPLDSQALPRVPKTRPSTSHKRPNITRKGS